MIGTWVWCIVHTCLRMVFKLVATDPHHTKEHIYRDNWQLWPASPSPVKALTLLLRAVHRCPSCTAGTSSTPNSFVASPSFSFFFPFLLNLLSRRFHPSVVHFSLLPTFHLHFPHPAVSGSSTISVGEQDSVSQFSSLFFYWAVFLSTRQLFFFLFLVLHLWPFLFKVFCLGSLEHLFLFLIICNSVLYFAFLWTQSSPPQSTKFKHCLTLLSFCSFLHHFFYLLQSSSPHFLQTMADCMISPNFAFNGGNSGSSNGSHNGGGNSNGRSGSAAGLNSRDTPNDENR